MNRKDRIHLTRWIVETAKKLGSDDVAAALSNYREIEIEYRDQKLDKVQESAGNSLSLELIVEQKYSSHSTSDLRKESLKPFIQEAVHSTKALEKDEFRALPDPSLYPKFTDLNLMIDDRTYEKIAPGKRVRLVGEIEKAAMKQSNQIISATASYSDIHAQQVRIHSNGFQGESSGTRFSMSAEVTVDDGQGGRPEDWFGVSTRYFSDLPSTQMIGENAARRALTKIGQKKIDSGRYTMIVENRIGARLTQMLYAAMNAQALQQKRSFLEGMLGKPIGSTNLTLIDDPFIEKGLGSRFFDSEGIGSCRRTLVEKGILKQYLIDNYYGRKLAMVPNSGSISNIIMEYGEQSPDDLIREIDQGIFVTGFIGGNSNLTTGDFSFGIMGRLIEKGQISQPVNEMNISGNALELYSRLTAVGNDPYPYSSQRLPALVFEDVNFSGI